MACAPARPAAERERERRRAQRQPAAAAARRPRPSRPETTRVASTSSASRPRASAISQGPSRISSGAVERLDDHAVGQRRERREAVVRAHHVQRHPAVAARRRCRAASRARAAPRPAARRARRRRGSAAPARRSRRAPAAASRSCPPGSPGAVARPPALWVSRSSICTKRPESGRLDQSALAVTWKSTTRPSPSSRPVTSGVPSSRLASTRPGRSGSGCAITWLEMSTSCGTARPANGLASGNGLQPPRRAPGHRPADRPAAGAQPHRQQRVLLELADAGLREPRAGEADEQPALLDPGHERVALGVAEGADVGEDEDVGRGVQHVGERRLDHLGEGLERAAQVVERIDEVLRLAAGAARHQPDLAPAHRVVGEHDAGGRAALGRAGCGRRGCAARPACRARARCGRRRRRTPRSPRPAPARCRSGRARSPSPRPGASRPAPARRAPTMKSPPSRRGGVSASAVSRRHHQRHRARGRAARGPGRPRRRARCRRSATASRTARPARRSSPPRRRGRAPRSAARGRRAARSSRRRRATAIASPGSGGAVIAITAAGRPSRDASSRAAAARSIRRVQSGASPQPPSRSTRSGSPDPSGRGFSTGPAKARIAAAERAHPEQEQPPRRALRHLLRIGQPEQQPHPGKRPPPRRRRHRAQQPPQHRQGGQREQQPGREEGHRTYHAVTPVRPPPCRARAGRIAAAWLVWWNRQRQPRWRA